MITNEKTSTFKKICTNAICAFQAIDQLKNILNELKLDNKEEVEIKKIDNLAQINANFHRSFQFINDKDHIKLIKKKINKRKSKKKRFTNEFYSNELKTLLGNPLFSHQREFDCQSKQNDLEQIVSNQKNENQKIDLEIEDLNAKIFELKQQREQTNCLIKLINLRSAQKSSNPKETSSNLIYLNEIKDQIDTRLMTFENERKLLKKRQKELNESEFQTNWNSWNRKQYNSTLKDYESLIKTNLFGKGSCGNENMDYFEMYQRQSELSVEHLLSIRHEWDYFLSTSMNAQSIPIEWVEPNQNPNEEWVKFVKYD